MFKSKIAGIGKYLPETVMTNDDLTKYMDTSDEWITERTGIKERRIVKRGEETTSVLGARAAEMAIERAGINKEDIDFIIFATISADYFFPGGGVLLQRELGITNTEIGALDIRNQCSGFIYALSVADQFIKTGMYKNVLVVGAEVHSAGLDYSTKGRGVSVIFGDGAGAVILQPTEDDNKGILTTKLHSDGTHAEELAVLSPGAHGGYFHKDEPGKFGFPDNPGGSFVTQKIVEDGLAYPYMNGSMVFKKAVTKFPEVIKEALEDVNKTKDDIDMVVVHQANLRIAQFVRGILDLPKEKMFNNIHKYGNTTAASIPIALCEAWEEGKIKDGDLVCLAAFGSGFTWASALLYW